MSYPYLKREMAERNVTNEAIANLLHIHRNSVHNKINYNSHFTVTEAIVIRNTFFPDLEIEELFKVIRPGVSGASGKEE